MVTIGIHPKLKNDAWLYGSLKRWLGYTTVSGQFDHLIPPGKTAKIAQPKRAALPTHPFNDGGRAA